MRSFPQIGVLGAAILRWIRARLSAIPPPLGRPGDGPMDSPFRIEYLDAERLLPLLVRKIA
jgi:hypothetical protein